MKTKKQGAKISTKYNNEEHNEDAEKKARRRKMLQIASK